MLFAGLGSLPAQAQHKSKPKKSAAHHAATPAGSSAGERELTQLARELREKPTGEVYERLSRLATEQGKTSVGTRAALALGYYDYGRNHLPEARKWLLQASGDPLLADYALYWQGLTDFQMGAHDAALEELRRYRLLYPDTVMSDTAVATLAQAALALNRPEEAVAILDSYPKTGAKASLVLLRARAQEKDAQAKGAQPITAAATYLDVVNRFPLSDEAKAATDRIAYLQLQLGDNFPGTPLNTAIARAEAFYDARRWNDVRSAERDLLPRVTGVARELVMLRLAQAGSQAGAGPQPLADLQLTNPDLDAERLYWLSQAQRKPETAPDMFATIEKLATQYPQSPWTEQALFAGGDYHWVNLERDQAAEYYQRTLSAFPAGRDAATCQWRIAWISYLERKPDAGPRIEDFLRKNPTSGYAVDALYWLGRSYEQVGNAPRARSFYLAAQTRFPQTYFALRAKDRLREIGSSPVESVELVAAIPPATPLTPFTDALPEAALPGWTRAQALESIAFDNSAELELRADYAQTHAPKLLLSVAQAAVAAGHYPAAIMATRQLVPMLEARQFGEVPPDAWRTVYPLPYELDVEREAARNNLDPMLVAGLIRQESAFVSGAVSYTGCCLGLMQILPQTGIRLAKHTQLKFSRSQLFDPQYNLRLGTHYLADLLDQFHTPEAALAAYNAGETKVIFWTTGQQYADAPEFVESIPITQTREYVQIVLRNADLYRRIYAESAAPAPPAPALPHGANGPLKAACKNCTEAR